MAKLRDAAGDRPRLERGIAEWLKSWPPKVEPKPANEPGSTQAEMLTSWNHYWVDQRHLEACEGDSWPGACFWFALRKAVRAGAVVVRDDVDHADAVKLVDGKCSGLCATTPPPMPWREATYGANWKERYIGETRKRDFTVDSGIVQ